jgi:hypothetical protein
MHTQRLSGTEEVIAATVELEQKEEELTIDLDTEAQLIDLDEKDMEVQVAPPTKQKATPTPSQSSNNAKKPRNTEVRPDDEKEKKSSVTAEDGFEKPFSGTYSPKPLEEDDEDESLLTQYVTKRKTPVRLSFTDDETKTPRRQLSGQKNKHPSPDAATYDADSSTPKQASSK